MKYLYIYSVNEDKRIYLQSMKQVNKFTAELAQEMIDCGGDKRTKKQIKEEILKEIYKEMFWE